MLKIRLGIRLTYKTESTANLCKIKGGKSGKFKFPTLVELYDFIYKESFTQAHNASADVEATA